mgnify:CR=1 FL=1
MKFSFREIALFAGIVLLGALCIGQCHQKNVARNERDSYAEALSKSEKTVEVGKGLFERKAAELDNLASILKERDNELADARTTIHQQKADVVAYSELSILWKKKYEGLAKATQTVVHTSDVPHSVDNPQPISSNDRLKVSFSKQMGPFDLSGYTLTSPPEAFVSLSQARPIKLGIHLVQLPDGHWSTIVATEKDAEYSVDVAVSAVNRNFERQNWRDKLSLDMSVGVYDTPSIGVGLRYGGALSLGPECSAYASTSVSWSCGIRVSWRPFDK